MSQMKAVQISKPGGDFELVERQIPAPGDGQVLVKVDACGICHSDQFVKEGLWPGIEYPRIPGHEVAGRIEQMGKRVVGWKPGDRVGVGWHGGYCFYCDACRKGDFALCERGLVTGISHDGGYAEYCVVPQESLARVPTELEVTEAAPLLCAGVTTYNALRNSGARPGDLVAIQGVGGLGHLAIQYAWKMGFRTVALSQSDDKQELARELGADLFISGSSEKAAEELTRLGGAVVALATAPNSKAIASLVHGLAPNGKLIIIAAADQPIEVSALHLIGGRRSVQGWPSGYSRDSEATMNFSANFDVRPRIERFPLEKVDEAYERMITNRARFRVVLEM